MNTENKVKWYDKQWLFWALLVFVPYIGIPFMWIRKKEFTNKKKVVLSIIFIIWFFIIIGIGSTEPANSDVSAESSSSVSSVETSDEEKEGEDVPNIELANDFEKSVWETIKNNNGTLNAINSNDTLDETPIVSIDISCENDEAAVTPILESIAAIGTDNAIDKVITVSVKDAKDAKEDNLSNLVIADIQTDGTIDIAFESPDYNSYRNVWIQDQFSVWNGAHTELEKLIIDNLNDEKSYEHIETTYIDVNSEERKETVNKILSDAGYSQRVEIDDLFISTKFSAKNGFGGTIKNTAYGIASYSNQTITLVAIE